MKSDLSMDEMGGKRRDGEELYQGLVSGSLEWFRSVYYSLFLFFVAVSVHTLVMFVFVRAWVRNLTCHARFSTVWAMSTARRKRNTVL